MKERRRGAVRLLALLMAIMLLVPTISAAAAGGKEDRTAIDYSGQTEWPAVTGDYRRRRLSDRVEFRGDLVSKECG